MNNEQKAKKDRVEVHRIAPVQGYSAGIPWALHIRAWEVYAAKYGKYQSAERMAERGGFCCDELDIFIPGWRDEVSGMRHLQSENAELNTRLEGKCRELEDYYHQNRDAVRKWAMNAVTLTLSEWDELREIVDIGNYPVDSPAFRAALEGGKNEDK